MEFLLVPAGEFRMGSEDGDSDEKPVHQVRITKAFYLGKYEVTPQAYAKVTGKTSSCFIGDANPVESVSWRAVTVFCRKLSDGLGLEVRLPTEAEWEYACRAGTGTRFSYGDDPEDSQLGEYAWYSGNSGSQTHAVGGKKPNPWGLYDMHGNVWEWCSDWYDRSYYNESPPQNPGGAQSGRYRVLRGGSWCDGGSELRAADRRSGIAPDYYNNYFGFRLAAGVRR